MERQAESPGQAVFQAHAWVINNDPEVKRLRGRITALDGKIKALETRFPSNCDVASVEMYMAGALDQPAKDFMETFLGQHAVVREYCDALLRHALLERVLAATIRKLTGAVIAN